MTYTPYQAAHKIAVLQVARDQLDAEIAELKDLFRQGTTVALVDETNSGGPALVVKITPNKRIDDKLAREVLDEDTYNNVSKRVIDTAKARAFLTTDGINQITKTYENKVEVQVQ